MHPILFRIPLPDFLPWKEIPIHSFGAMLAIAFLAGMWRLDRYGKQLGLDRKRLSDLSLWVLVSVILGCRILYFVVHPSQFSFLGFFEIWTGGLVFYGGFIAAILVGNWKARQYGFRLLQVTDIAMVAAFLGIFLGRWGCLLVGDDYGRPVPPGSLPWALHVPDPLPERSLLPPPPEGGELYLHPTQVYMSLNGLLLFFLGHAILRRQRAWGTASCCLLTLYAITRSLIEIYRGDHEARGFLGPLSTSQWISIPLGAAGLLGLWLLRNRRGEGPVFAKTGDPRSA